MNLLKKIEPITKCRQVFLSLISLYRKKSYVPGRPILSNNPGIWKSFENIKPYSEHIFIPKTFPDSELGEGLSSGGMVLFFFQASLN